VANAVGFARSLNALFERLWPFDALPPEDRIEVMDACGFLAYELHRFAGNIHDDVFRAA
jgi:hypothetical protein